MPKYREPSIIIHMQFFHLYSVPSVSSHFREEKHTLIWHTTILVGLRRVIASSLRLFTKAAIIETQEMGVRSILSTYA
jgi:hypothetical protein